MTSEDTSLPLRPLQPCPRLPVPAPASSPRLCRPRPPPSPSPSAWTGCTPEADDPVQGQGQEVESAGQVGAEVRASGNAPPDTIASQRDGGFCLVFSRPRVFGI